MAKDTSRTHHLNSKFHACLVLYSLWAHLLGDLQETQAGLLQITLGHSVLLLLGVLYAPNHFRNSSPAPAIRYTGLQLCLYGCGAEMVRVCRVSR